MSAFAIPSKVPVPAGASSTGDGLTIRSGPVVVRGRDPTGEVHEEGVRVQRPQRAAVW